MRHRQMRIECRTVGPVFIEDKNTGVCRIDMEVIVDAACLGPRGGDLRVRYDHTMGRVDVAGEATTVVRGVSDRPLLAA